MVRYDDEADTFPHETILSKLEVTEMGPIDNHAIYDRFARQQLIDKTPDGVMFESEKNFKKNSKPVLNLRYRGDPYGKLPSHPELMLADTTPDPRGPDGNPLLYKMREHRAVRARQEAKKMHNQSEQRPEGPLLESQVMRIKQQVNRRYADNIKFFSRQYENDIRGTKAALPDPQGNFKYILHQDIDSDITEPRPYDQLMQRNPGQCLPNYRLKHTAQTDHLFGNDYISMSRHQKRELSKQVVNAAKRVEVQDLSDGLANATNARGSTPTDVAKIYRDICHEQDIPDQSNTATNSRTGVPNGDTVKAATQSTNSESFVTGPEGFRKNKNGAPQGTGGVSRDGQSDQYMIDITEEFNNKSTGKLPANKCQVGITEPSHVNVYINNAVIIAKALKMPDNRKRRIQMADVQHAGVMLGFMDTNQNNLRLMKSMLPVINNHAVAQNSEYFVNNPAMAEEFERTNLPGTQPRQHQSKMGISDIDLEDDASNENSVIKGRQLDTFKSRVSDFVANDDELLFSGDNSGRTRGGARIRSGFLRNSDASESFVSNAFC
jgi:hypothetical protein